MKVNHVEQCEQRNNEFLFESKVNDDHDVNIELEDVKFENTQCLSLLLQYIL